MWLTNILEEVEIQMLQQVSNVVKVNRVKTLQSIILRLNYTFDPLSFSKL